MPDENINANHIHRLALIIEHLTKRIFKLEEGQDLMSQAIDDLNASLSTLKTTVANVSSAITAEIQTLTAAAQAADQSPSIEAAKSEIDSIITSLEAFLPAQSAS